jgi:hypothetical protein
VIAILDSGVDPAHPDLAGKLVPGYNAWDGNANTADVYGHGTMVAGTAAAIGDNATGVASVAPLAGIMPIRVTGTNGWATDFSIYQGLIWAVDHGAKVMNVSFAGIAGSSAITSAAQYVASQGGVVVGAAGNCGCVDATPKNPYILSVGATDQGDSLTWFSSRGEYVDLSAPGIGILTTTNGGGYGSVAGTSFSSPITAGVIALMLSANMDLAPAQLEAIILSTADDLGTPGWDSSFGFGRVNADRAVRAAAAAAPVPDTTPPSVGITSPADGTTVSGPLTVAVAAADNDVVARVDLYVDGALLASDSTPAYSFYWDTTSLASGPHALTAVAVDGTGNSATSATITVSKAPPIVTDTTPPSVAITSVIPRRKLRVIVEASDDVGVASVELYLDGERVGRRTSAPYSFGLNLQNLTPGVHTFTAKAYDAAGNVATSLPVTYTK